jgi:competence protein ComEC
MLAAGASQFWMDSPRPVEPLRLRRVPLLSVALCFATGDALALHWHLPLILVAATASLLLLTLISLRLTPRVAILPALSLCVATGCWCAQMQPPVDRQLDLLHYADGLSRNVRGTVIRVRDLTATPTDNTPALHPWQLEPGAWETDPAPTTQSIDLDVTAIEDLTPDISWMQPVHGGLRITLQGEALPLHCGQVIELPLRLRVPEIYRDPGAWSYADYLLSEGIAATANAPAKKLQLHEAAKPSWHCRLYAAQSWATHRLQRFIASPANHALPTPLQLTPDDAGLLNATLFGDRTHLTHALREGFERTGTFHLFVVAGLHVALFSAGLLWLLRRMRLPEGLAVLLALTAATGYALLTGFGVPTQRALMMTAVYLIARWLDREVSALNALGAAALAVLVLDPRALFTSSFQMTFLVIISVAGLALPIEQRLLRPYARALEELDILYLDAHLHPRLAQLRVRARMAEMLTAALLSPRLRRLPTFAARAALWLAAALLFGLITELCMMLPMAVYFHRATLFALPINLIDLPLLSVLLCSALSMFCTSLLSAKLAILPGALTALTLHLMRATVDSVRSTPMNDVRIATPTNTAILAAALAIAAACITLRARPRLLFLTGLLATALLPVAVLLPAKPDIQPNTLEVTALDVAQGDSLLIVSPTGHTLLIDAGGPTGRPGLNLTLDPTTNTYDIGEQVVAPYLWSRRIARLDAVALTHAHSDHMGGMFAILRDLRPRELWLAAEPADSPALQSLLAEAATLNITVRHFAADDLFLWHGLTVTVLAPEPAYTNPGASTNNDSLVLRLDYGLASALLSGDAERSSEDAMLDHQRLAPVTLLKIGHHGSRTSTNPEFLDALTPQAAVISVGRHNTFGHPRADVLSRLEAAHTQTWRTDRVGLVTFHLTQDGRISTPSTASK